MKPTTALRPLISAVACLSVPVSLALAHPGHDHSDVPSVLRRPFAGPEHIVVTAVVGAMLALGAFLLARRARRQKQAQHR